MTATPIHGGIVRSDQKQQMLDCVAQCFDAVTEHFEGEPDMLVFGFATVGGRTSTHWIAPGEGDESYVAGAMLSNLSISLLRSVVG